MTLPTKICAKCSIEKPLTSFAGRQRTCIDCVQAAKARTLARKEAVAWTPALGERICDLVSMGSTIAQIAEMAGMPTARQMAAWRRQHEEFHDAYEVARQARADARSDRVDRALNDLRAGKISAADCRVIVETELKLASKESPARYGEKIEVTAPDAVKASVTAVMAIEALLAALPAAAGALPAPEPLTVEATPAAAAESDALVDPFSEPDEDLPIVRAA